MLEGILVVSFGTTYEETAKKNILPVEQALEQAYPHSIHGTAYTSSMVRQRLEKKGLHKDSLSQALEKMKQAKVTHLRIIPTHLLYGIEYEKIHGLCREWNDKFTEIILCKPLFGTKDSMKAVANILGQCYPPEQGNALLCVGHGSAHHSNSLYPEWQNITRAMGNNHCYVCTLEAEPSLASVIPLLQKEGFHHVHVIPLMLVAGDHVQQDIISEDEDSICSQLKQEGFSVSYDPKGLGEYPEIPPCYVKLSQEGSKL